MLASYEKDPHVLPLWNLFDFGGSVWRVMEHAEGRSLGEFLQNLERPFPWEQAYRLLSPVAVLLSRNMAKFGVADTIGPWSLFVRSQDRAFLLQDFGMVRREWDELRETFLPFPWAGTAPSSSISARSLPKEALSLLWDPCFSE